MNTENRPIQICFIAPKAYPLFNPKIEEVFGGAEVDLYFLATELAKDGNFAVSFITADYGQNRTETIEGVRVIKSLDFKENPLTGALKIWQAMKAADAQMYLIKTISPGMFLVAFFCRLKKRVFLYRTSNTNSCDGIYLSQHPVLGRIYKWALRTARVVLVQNKTDKENLRRTTGITSIAIPNGHRLAEPDKTKGDTILWVGRSTNIKKPELFIDLAEQIPDEKFTFVCQHATDDKKYDKLAARAKNITNLEFIEQVPFNRIDSFFQHAKMFVNTSDAEGFPNTFIQACRFAVPILSFSVNPDGFLDKYKCGICAEKNWERFIDGFKMLTEPAKAQQYGENGRRYIEEHHDIKRIVEEYKHLLRTLS